MQMDFDWYRCNDFSSPTSEIIFVFIKQIH